MLQIRKSDDQGFYNLLEVDDQGNETVLLSDHSLIKINKHPKLKNAKIKPELESAHVKRLHRLDGFN